MAELYDRTIAEAREVGLAAEPSTCAVVAVAVATGESYARVHAMMAARGRKYGAGTPMRITFAVLKALGWRWVDETAKYVGEIQHGYAKTSWWQPGGRITTKRTGKVKTVITAERHLPDDEVWLVRTGGRTTAHILCVRDGEAQDWSQGRRNAVRKVYRLVRPEPAGFTTIGDTVRKTREWIGG